MLPVTLPRPIALLAVALVAGACTSAQSSASPADEPLPTIGLDSELDPASVTGAADVRAIGADEVDTIVMIGDSITNASKDALAASFAELGFDEPVIVAQDGKRMAEDVGDNASGADVAALLTADDEPDESRANELWIVALGTNDVGNYDAAEAAAAVNEVLGRVPDDAPLVWVDTYFRDRSAAAAQLNQIISDRIERRGNAVVAAWSFFAGGDGVLRVDGVHPSTSGTEVFATVVTETAARFLGR